MIYLDNNATTQLDPFVVDAMMPYLTTDYGNPGSLYSIGKSARDAVEAARSQVASFLNANPNQIIFTSSGSEANAMAIMSSQRYLKMIGKEKILVSEVEHDSVLKAACKVASESRFDFVRIPVNNQGVVEERFLDERIDSCTGLVSVMYVNNETGSVNPIKEIAKLCKGYEALFHTDCVQACGSFPIDVNEIGCNMLSISSHKIHGPKGCGALYCSDRSVLSPWIPGGSMQEFGLRGGTENVPSIVGFGKACEIMMHNLRSISIYTSELKQAFFMKLKEELESYSLGGLLKVNGESIVKPGKTLNIRFGGIDGETLLLLLDRKGVCVSAGSACRSLESTPSHVLLAMGIDPEDAHNSIRISFSKMNEMEEVVEGARITAACVKALHDIG